ncbi:MAG TPA: hypothetical protein VGF61_23005 [Candidatus Acidoferrum sp.]
MSSFVIGAWSWSSSSLPKAAAVPGKSAAPMVVAPAATIPFFKNDRRLLALLKTLPFSFIAISRTRIVNYLN